MERTVGVHGAHTVRRQTQSLWIPLRIENRTTRKSSTLYLSWSPAMVGGELSRGIHLASPRGGETPDCEGITLDQSNRSVRMNAPILGTTVQNLLGDLLLPEHLRVTSPPISTKVGLKGIAAILLDLDTEIRKRWMNPWGTYQEDHLIPTVDRWLRIQEDTWRPWFEWIRHRMGSYAVVREYMTNRELQYLGTPDLSQALPERPTAEYAVAWLAAERSARYSMKDLESWQLSNHGSVDCRSHVGMIATSACKSYANTSASNTIVLLTGAEAISKDEYETFCNGRGYIEQLLPFSQRPAKSEVRILAAAVCRGRLHKFVDMESLQDLDSESYGQIGTARSIPIFGGHVTVDAPITAHCDSSSPGTHTVQRTKVRFYTSVRSPGPQTRTEQAPLLVHLDVESDHVAEQGNVQGGHNFTAYLPEPTKTTHDCPHTCSKILDEISHDPSACTVRRSSIYSAINDLVSILETHTGTYRHQGNQQPTTTPSPELNALKVLLLGAIAPLDQ